MSWLQCHSRYLIKGQEQIIKVRLINTPLLKDVVYMLLPYHSMCVWYFGRLYSHRMHTFPIKKCVWLCSIFDTQHVIDKCWAAEAIASRTGVLDGHFPKHRLHQGTGTKLTVLRSVHCGSDQMTANKHTRNTYTPTTHTRCLLVWNYFPGKSKCAYSEIKANYYSDLLWLYSAHNLSLT